MAPTFKIKDGFEIWKTNKHSNMTIKLKDQYQGIFSGFCDAPVNSGLYKKSILNNLEF